ncbi:SMP-30/gluconolactonase/LRE family protein [Aeromicrobium sp. 9AM]|uniref:SMP-30/gluconolactonase/LRE family protein n=1 Tax=Aeromicrobium sp. 9AM TaxID=2653126 RepID=UPI0012F0D943|nr:SMP-30/gluconolactonase/LRE family protein [Aeromicrobium sp. 9AM]VXB63125.1 Gluconolactonase protein [Aeromicrobium sp. 9AM]
MTVTFDPEVLVNDFGQMPQGADVLPDGRFVSVDVHTGEVIAFSPDTGRREVIARTSSGPIGVTLGDDGALYLAHTGGRLGDFWEADDAIAPCIQRLEVGSDRPVTILTEVGGSPLVAPHDIAWGADGRLYFTDSHIWQWDPLLRTGAGRIVAISPDGSADVVVETGVTFPCGIVGEPDGSIVWTESYADRVLRRRPSGSIEVIATLPPGHTPHGVRIGADGALWVASFGSSTIDEIAPDGSSVTFHDVPGYPMNFAFLGSDLIVAAFKDAPDDDMDGLLFRVGVGTPGDVLLRGRVG